MDLYSARKDSDLFVWEKRRQTQTKRKLKKHIVYQIVYSWMGAYKGTEVQERK